MLYIMLKNPTLKATEISGNNIFVTYCVFFIRNCNHNIDITVKYHILQQPQQQICHKMFFHTHKAQKIFSAAFLCNKAHSCRIQQGALETCSSCWFPEQLKIPRNGRKHMQENTDRCALEKPVLEVRDRP